MGTRTQKLSRYGLPVVMTALILLAACAATPATSTVIRTAFDLPADHAGFRNMLVISVAGDYDSRALFEQKLAAAFANSESRVTAYYTVVGRQPFLTRTALDTAILSRKFDAVLLTRLKGQEQAELVTNRPVGQSFDLFGYDYAELNVASPIEQASTITFVTELYPTSTRKKVWAIDTLSFDKPTATDLIDEQVATIVTQLRTDDLLAP